MKPVITYKYVAPNTQEFQQLQTFATSFNHKIEAHPSGNTYAYYRGDTCVGYGDQVFVPTVYPAFHPGITRPQDVIQVLSDWRAHSALSSKPVYIGVPLEGHRNNFPEKIMEKLGLARLHRELYTVA